MKPGSVIVDMAAANGGNVEGAGRRRDGRHRQRRARSSATPTSPGRLPTQASQLYGTNLVNLLKLLTPGKDGAAGARLRRRRAARHDRGAATARRPGRRRRSRSRAAPAVGRRGGRRRRPAKAANRRTRAAAYAVVALGGRALRWSPRSRPPSFLGHFTVFALAIVIGFYVIGQRAPRAAHAADVGDQRDLRDHRGRRAAADRPATTRWSRALAFVAILLASINVFGGFAVTRRMLEMFRKG